MVLLGYMRSEVPPPMGPETVPIKNRPAPNHEGYLKENAAASDEEKIEDQLVKNKRDILLAQLSHGSGFPAAMQHLNDIRDNLKAPKPLDLELRSDSPGMTPEEKANFNAWVNRVQSGEPSVPPPSPKHESPE